MRVRVEWTFAMQSGPVVGSAVADSRGAALDAMCQALREAVGGSDYGRHYDAPMRRLRALTMAPAGPVEWSSPGVRIVLTEIGEK
jgi:hypothetical protein